MMNASSIHVMLSSLSGSCAAPKCIQVIDPAIVITEKDRNVELRFDFKTDIVIISISDAIQVRKTLEMPYDYFITLLVNQKMKKDGIEE